MWLFYADRAFELADERRREADEWRLARSVPQAEMHDPIRHLTARTVAAASRALASFARALDAHSLEDHLA